MASTQEKTPDSVVGRDVGIGVGVDVDVDVDVDVLSHRSRL